MIATVEARDEPPRNEKGVLAGSDIKPNPKEGWSSPEKVDTASAAGLMVSLDGDFGFENEY